MEQDRYARARLLFEQSRYDAAGKEVLARLAQEPDDPDGYILLALCQNALNLPEARDTAHRAVELAPDEDRAHFVVSLTAAKRREYVEAEAAVRLAIGLNSWNAHYFGHLAAVHIFQYRWAEALAAADEGLAIDPEDDACLNHRAVALTKLGRHGEAARTLEGTLEKHPEDSFTHANRGWSLLHENESRQAIEHFREALRLDPNSAWAKEGLLEALRAKSWFYRRVLQFFLWVSRFPPRVQFGIVIGFLVLVRVLDGLGDAMPAAAPLFSVLIFGYCGFAAATWFAKPIRDGILAFDRDGRLVLSREDKWVAGVVVVLLLVLLSLVAGAVFGDIPECKPAAVFAFIVAVHFASVWAIPSGRFRWRGAAASVAILGLFAWERVERFGLMSDFDAVYREAVAFDDQLPAEKARVSALPEAERPAAWRGIQLRRGALEIALRQFRGRAERLNSYESVLSFLSLAGLFLHAALAGKARRSR